MSRGLSGMYIVGEIRGTSQTKTDSGVTRHVYIETVDWQGKVVSRKVKDRFKEVIDWDLRRGEVVCLAVETGVYEGQAYMSASSFGPTAAFTGGNGEKKSTAPVGSAPSRL